jgi:gliding motility-associated-like protein
MRLLSFLFLYFYTLTLNAQTPVFTASQEVTTAGSEVTVVIKVDSLKNAVSIQFSLSWDSDILSYQSTGDYGLPGSSDFNFGETQVDQGILTFVWFDGQVNGLALPDGSIIFSVTLNAIGQVGEQSVVEFVNSPTPIQVGIADGINISEVSGIYRDGLVQIITNSVNLQDIITPIQCFGAATGSIDITLEGGLPPYEYNWTGPNDFDSNDSSLVNLNAGEYSVTVNDQLGNTNVAIYTVNQATAIQVDGLSITPTACNQATGSITLSTSGGTPGYSYNYGNGFIREATQTNLAAGIYTLLIQDAANCQIDTLITIVEADKPSIDLGQDRSICTGEDLPLSAGTENALTYQWSFNGIPLTVTTAALTVQQAGLYSVTVTSADACTASDTIQVNTVANPTVSLGPDLEICPRTTTSLLADMGLLRYEWFFNNIPFGDSDAEMEVTEPGTYTLLVTDTNGCKAKDTLLLTQANVLVATAGPDTTITEGDSVQLFATGGSTYQWAADLELSCYDCANPVTTPSQTTTYQVIIRSEEGCESEELFTVEVVEVSDLLVDLVNFISPNGDGKNDFLFFNGLENYKTSQLSIFNRWGDLLFNKINYQGDGTYWEATYKGQPLPAGVYYYVLRLGQIDEPIRSSLTIVRN